MHPSAQQQPAHLGCSENVKDLDHEELLRLLQDSSDQSQSQLSTGNTQKQHVNTCGTPWP